MIVRVDTSFKKRNCKHTYIITSINYRNEYRSLPSKMS